MKVYDPCIFLPVESIAFPLTHPVKIAQDNDADRYTQRYIYFRSNWRALELISRYLWKNLLKDPSNIFRAVKLVLGNCVAEIRRRLKCLSLLAGFTNDSH